MGLLRLSSIFCILTLVISCQPAPDVSEARTFQSVVINGIDVERYDVEITPDFETATITGREVIKFRRAASLPSIVTFNGKGIRVTRAQLNGERIKVTNQNDALQVPLGGVGLDFELSLDYIAKPSRGYVADGSAIFTGYFACDWMICRQTAFEKSSGTDLSALFAEWVY